MTSSIDNTSIDDTYPIAGKDNDSQGFRDNFQTIKNNFTAAKNEITALQNDTAKKNVNNVFLWNQISQVKLANYGETLYNGNNVGSGTDLTLAVPFTNGSIQKFQLAGNVTFNITEFPADGIGARLRIHLTGNGDPHAATFTVPGPGSIKMNPTTRALFPSVVCTATTASTDYITCTGASTLTENMPIVFSGTPGGGIIAGTIYFVKVINSSTQFSISESTVSGAAGPTKQLTDTTGLTMTGTMKIGVTHSSNPMVFDFWTYDDGATVFMDYLGTFS
jgi:hypothetical protein